MYKRQLGNEFVRGQLERIVPGLGDKVSIANIANGINMHKFQYRHKERGKNLAYIGSLNMKKNPALLLHNFKRLVEIDDEYRLFVAGKYQDDVLKQYMDYMNQQMTEGVYIKSMSRHLLGLFAGQKGAKAWRRYISENAHKPGSGIEVIEKAASFLET